MIRAARPDDLEAVLRLSRQLNPDDPPLTDAAARPVFDAILAAPGLTLFVLEHEGRVAATTYLNVIPNLTRGASPYAVIENVVVDESLRGTGLGKRLMAATVDAAWRAGCYKVMLATSSTEESTHAFYRACGFSSDEKTAYLVRRPATAG